MTILKCHFCKEPTMTGCYIGSQLVGRCPECAEKLRQKYAEEEKKEWAQVITPAPTINNNNNDN